METVLDEEKKRKGIFFFFFWKMLVSHPNSIKKKVLSRGGQQYSANIRKQIAGANNADANHYI